MAETDWLNFLGIHSLITYFLLRSLHLFKINWFLFSDLFLSSLHSVLHSFRGSHSLISEKRRLFTMFSSLGSPDWRWDLWQGYHHLWYRLLGRNLPGLSWKWILGCGLSRSLKTVPGFSPAVSFPQVKFSFEKQFILFHALKSLTKIEGTFKNPKNDNPRKLLHGRGKYFRRVGVKESLTHSGALIKRK